MSFKHPKPTERQKQVIYLIFVLPTGFEPMISCMWYKHFNPAKLRENGYLDTFKEPINYCAIVMDKKHSAAGRGLLLCVSMFSFLCSRRDLNSRPPECKSDALHQLRYESIRTGGWTRTTVSSLWERRKKPPPLHRYKAVTGRVWTDILLAPTCYSRTAVLQGHLTNWTYGTVIRLGIEPCNLTLPLKRDTHVLWLPTTVTATL